MKDAFGFGLLALGFAGVGLAVALALGVPATRGWVPTLVGIAPMVGLVVSGGAGVVLLALGVGVHPVAVLAVGLAAALVAWRVRLRLQPAAWRVRPHGRRLSLVAEAIVLLAFVPVSIALLRLAAASGPAWDGWAIWGVKAQALLADGELGTPVLTDPFYLGSQRAYPVLAPALAATGARAVGGYDPLLGDVVGSFALVFMGLAVWGILRTLMPGWVAAAVGLAAAGSWPLVLNQTDGYADALLACVVALGVLCLTVAVATRSGVALALGLGALGLGALVKSEGLLFALAALVALGVAVILDRRPLRPLILPAALTLLPGLAWAAWAGGRDDVLDRGEIARPGALWADRDRGADAVGAMVEALQTSWRPAAVLALCGVALALLARRFAVAALFLVWAVLGLAGLTLVYVISRTDIDWHLESSADRVVLAIGLTSAVVGPLLASDGWASLARQREQSGVGPGDDGPDPTGAVSRSRRQP